MFAQCHTMIYVNDPNYYIQLAPFWSFSSTCPFLRTIFVTSIVQYIIIIISTRSHQQQLLLLLLEELYTSMASFGPFVRGAVALLSAFTSSNDLLMRDILYTSLPPSGLIRVRQTDLDQRVTIILYISKIFFTLIIKNFNKTFVISTIFSFFFVFIKTLYILATSHFLETV